MLKKRGNDMNSKEKMNQVLELLTKLEIPFQVVEHEPVCTIEEANHISNMIEGIGTKSLFLKDKKKNYWNKTHIICQRRRVTKYFAIIKRKCYSIWNYK